MAKINPNEPCPCGSDIKFKKCCKPYIEGKHIENPERLLRVRYVATINHDVKFLWESLHPESATKLHERFSRFEYDLNLVKHLKYKSIVIADEDYSKANEAVIVFYVTVFDGDTDVSFIEEAKFSMSDGKWFYYDGLRRSSNRIGCDPLSVKVGELKTFFLYDSSHN